jgi:hypothetical protein
VLKKYRRSDQGFTGKSPTWAYFPSTKEPLRARGPPGNWARQSLAPTLLKNRGRPDGVGRDSVDRGALLPTERDARRSLLLNEGHTDGCADLQDLAGGP